MGPAEPVRITVVAEADLADLLPLMRGYCDFYQARPTDEALRAMSMAFLRDPEHEGQQLLARDPAGRAVGFATCLWTWDTTLAARVAVMEDLYVMSDLRGAGVGRRLIEACAALARERGYRWLHWQTAPDNLTAQRLYDATGARRSSWYAYRLPTG